MKDVFLQLVPVLKQMVEFLSKRLAAIVALGALFYFAPTMQLSMQCLLAACVLAFIISETKLKGGKGKPVRVAPVAKVAAPVVPKAVPMFLVCLLVPFFAQAELLPYIDQLDLQAGPGLEVIDWRPFEAKECLIATARIPKLEYGKVHFRVGGLLNDVRSALVLSVNRSLNDVIIRNDDGTQKVLLPTIGIWLSGYRVDNKNKLTVGVNACYEY